MHCHVKVDVGTEVNLFFNDKPVQLVEYIMVVPVGVISGYDRLFCRLLYLID